MRLILYLLCLHLASSGEFDILLSSDLQALITSVDNIFEYLNSNVKLMDVNTMFGVFLAKVNLLSATNDAVKLPSTHEEDLKRMIHYCNVLLYYYQVTETTEEGKKTNGSKTVTATSLYNVNSATEWAETMLIYSYSRAKVTEQLRSTMQTPADATAAAPAAPVSDDTATAAQGIGHLDSSSSEEQTPNAPNSSDSYSHIQKIKKQRKRKAMKYKRMSEEDIISKWNAYKNAVQSYNRHTPNPNSTNMCLHQLALSAYPPPAFTSCKVTSKCVDIILLGTNFGYSMTHRLLLVMTALFSRYCYMVSPESDTELMDNICVKAYSKETSSIYTYVKLEQPPFILKDLFMEQISLCSLIGHVQFLQRDWLNAIMSWQSRSGCFSNTKELDKHKKAKCEAHMTSVALAALTSGIRFIAEFYYENILRINDTKIVPPLIDSDELVMKGVE